MICAPDGGILDDLIVYRLAPERFLVVANASNTGVVSDALAERLVGMKVVLDDRSLDTALVSIQGPASAAILAGLTDVDLGALRYYAIAEGTVAGVPALVARTGYTGEDGFEVFVEWERAGVIWDALLAAGAPAGAVPVGLGARDTLRLEAGMPLYGNELDTRARTRSRPASAASSSSTARRTSSGARALEKVAAEGPRRRLVGLAVRGRGIARHGYPVLSGEAVTGAVTSGTQSPTLGIPIAMAYVAPRDAEPGTMLDVAVREQRVAAEVVPLPFYRRPR